MVLANYSISKSIFSKKLYILLQMGFYDGWGECLDQLVDDHFTLRLGKAKRVRFNFNRLRCYSTSGGILLVLPKTRVVGATLVAITFIVSAVVLVIAENIPLTIITLICVSLLGLIK